MFSFDYKIFGSLYLDPLRISIAKAKEFFILTGFFYRGKHKSKNISWWKKIRYYYIKYSVFFLMKNSSRSSGLSEHPIVLFNLVSSINDMCCRLWFLMLIMQFWIDPICLIFLTFDIRHWDLNLHNQNQRIRFDDTIQNIKSFIFQIQTLESEFRLPMLLSRLHIWYMCDPFGLWSTDAQFWVACQCPTCLEHSRTHFGHAQGSVRFVLISDMLRTRVGRITSMHRTSYRQARDTFFF